MSAFTPGPWELSLIEGGFRIRMETAIDSPSHHDTQHEIEMDFCLYPYDGKQYDEAHANARLIVAAPKLYAAGKRVTDAFRALGTASGVIPSIEARHECEAAMTALDAALAKAVQP